MVPYATLRLRLFPHLRWGFANYSISHRNKRLNLLFRKDILFTNIHCCNLTGCCHFYIFIIHTVIFLSFKDSIFRTLIRNQLKRTHKICKSQVIASAINFAIHEEKFQ